MIANNGTCTDDSLSYLLYHISLISPLTLTSHLSALRSLSMYVKRSMKYFSLPDLNTGNVLVLVLLLIDQASPTTWRPLSVQRSDVTSSHCNVLALSLRGGSKEVISRRGSKAKKSLKRNKTSSQDFSRVSEERAVINAAIREKDAAVAMGDAIR